MMRPSYMESRESPHATLHDLYGASRVLGAAPITAVKRGENTSPMPVEENAVALRTLRGTRTVTDFISGTGLPFSTYYEQERGSQPKLADVERVWVGLGYDVQFLATVPKREEQPAPKSRDFMNMSQEEVITMLRSYFPNS